MRITSNHLIQIGFLMPFKLDKFLDQLPTLMTVVHDGDEDKIRNAVATVVET